MNGSKSTRALIESAMMVALATVLSILKIIEMPYGGSVTIASMLPMVVLSYRHGAGYGLGAGLCYAIIQQLLGLKDLSYFTTWQSIVAIIFLDYIIAFTVVGFGGVFRKFFASQRSALTLGAGLVCVLRYLCHTVSGATVWAGLSIPSSAALIYSIGYNATYMLPEGIVLCAVAYYLGGVIDFSKTVPTRMANKSASDAPRIYPALSGLSLLVGMIIDLCLIAPCLQDAETGEFVFSGIVNANWLAVAIVSLISVVFALSLFIVGRKKDGKV